jgi:cytochrome c556
MSETKLRIWGVVAVVLAVAVAATAMAATEVIKQRQEAMEKVYEGMKTLGAIAKKEQPFDAEVVQASAAKIADHLAQSAELFPEGSDNGDVQTWAKPEIWSNRGHFDELMVSTRQAAVDMQSVTEAGELMPALGKLGGGCKSCHEMYRLPKN